MLSKKMVAIIAAGALAACLGLAACGGSASSSAASSSAASSSAASAATTTSSAAASSTAASSAAPASSAATSASAAPSATASSAAYIGEDAAKDIALKDAGFAAGDVTELKCELDTDDGVVHYDVDFKQGGKEYDYDIDATTGAIIKAKSEVDD